MDTMDTVIAVDPGANGGLAYRVPYVPGTVAVKMPATEADLVDELYQAFDYLSRFATQPILIVEEVGGYVGKNQPGSSMFKFGRGVGVIHGAALAIGFRIVTVRPQKWQKALGLGTSRGLTPVQWKNKLKAEAQRRFPGVKVTLANADALLMLDAARQLI